MRDRLVYLGWVLLGSLSAAGLSLGLGWLVGAFWVGFAITLVGGCLAFVFAEPVIVWWRGCRQPPKGKHHR